MAHRIEISTEIDIQFSDESKAEAFFIEGDWKETFFTFNDLEDVSRHIAYGFQQAVGGWMVSNVDIEGFGRFEHKDKLWTSEYEEFGAIYIRIETEMADSSICDIGNFK